jgi:hypothetical protein
MDYIPVKHRYRKSVKNVQTLPGADIDSVHNALVANICTKLKKAMRFQKGKTDGIWRNYKLNDRKYIIG